MDRADFWNGIIRRYADSMVRATKTVTPPDTHRGWGITWDYGYFTAVGPDYDVSYEGPEDGWVDNGHRVSARTREELIEEIDAWFEEHGDAQPR